MICSFPNARSSAGEVIAEGGSFVSWPRRQPPRGPQRHVPCFPNQQKRGKVTESATARAPIDDCPLPLTGDRRPRGSGQIRTGPVQELPLPIRRPPLAFGH